jgi:hypothetical protein
MEPRTLHASGRSVFVCGSPYTEVSTVSWALTAHPAFWTSSESRFLYRLFGNRADNGRPYLYDIYCDCCENGAWMHTNAVPYPEFLAALGDGIAKLFQGRAGRRRWVDSSPDAVVVGLLQPTRTAAFIESAGRSELSPGRMRELTALNALYAERLANVANAAPHRVYLVEENDLFDRPETTLADLLEFLGEENNPAVAEMFASRLLRMNLPLPEAREALFGFEQTAPFLIAS